jgi:hypothetical protein
MAACATRRQGARRLGKLCQLVLDLAGRQCRARIVDRRLHRASQQLVAQVAMLLKVAVFADVRKHRLGSEKTPRSICSSSQSVRFAGR